VLDANIARETDTHNLDRNSVINLAAETKRAHQLAAITRAVSGKLKAALF